MKTIIAFITVIMAIAVNTANANGMDVQKYILDTVPGITAQEAAWCADAHRNGGSFVVKIHDISLKCSKNTIVKDWDLPSN